MMDPFHYRDGHLYCEHLAIADLAERFGTPLYVYSQNAILSSLNALKVAFAEVDALICYSVKANSNLAILKVMADHGSGFDVVSSGELIRVQLAGGSMGSTVFAGVGKTDEEVAAGLEAGVLMFNVESEAELDVIARVAASESKIAPIALRVNPDVDPKTHHYISTGKKESKFGMDIERTERLGRVATGMPSVRMIGMHMHIGSQITSTEPYASAVTRGIELIGHLRRQGHPIMWYNMGGGYGINYRGHEAQPIEHFARAIVPAVKSAGCRLAIEPGRVIVGNAGILVSRVIYTKQSGDKRFLIQDAAMNDLIRPALYDSFHRIWPVVLPEGLPPALAGTDAATTGTTTCDVVGPICESSDFLARDRQLPQVSRGELLATFSAGAYGMAMASNYNSRPRAAEVLVDHSRVRLVRHRETYEDLVRHELDGLT
jgi:diaminopimelate decarboxylase